MLDFMKTIPELRNPETSRWSIKLFKFQLKTVITRELLL